MGGGREFAYQGVYRCLQLLHPRIRSQGSSSEVLHEVQEALSVSRTPVDLRKVLANCRVIRQIAVLQKADGRKKRSGRIARN